MQVVTALETLSKIKPTSTADTGWSWTQRYEVLHGKKKMSPVVTYIMRVRKANRALHAVFLFPRPSML